MKYLSCKKEIQSLCFLLTRKVFGGNFVDLLQHIVTSLCIDTQMILNSLFEAFSQAFDWPLLLEIFVHLIDFAWHPEFSLCDSIYRCFLFLRRHFFTRDFTIWKLFSPSSPTFLCNFKAVHLLFGLDVLYALSCLYDKASPVSFILISLYLLLEVLLQLAFLLLLSFSWGKLSIL